MCFRVLVLVGMLATSGLGDGGHWPQWRGPTGNGVAPDGSYPRTWNHKNQVAWKVDLPGRGSSTPAVWGDHIFLTCPVGGQNGVLCFDWEGKLLWEKKIEAVRPGRHRKGSGTNPSPVADGRHVYVYFKSGDLACLDFKGRIVWQRNLQEDYGKDALMWDLGTSPVLMETGVVIACMQNGPSYLAAFDKLTGRTLWKSDRRLRAPDESADSYTTPVVYKQEGLECILTLGADHVTGHDAQTGKEIWRLGGLNPDGAGNWRSISSPAVEGGRAVFSYGRGGTLVGLRVGGKGDVTTTHKAWSHPGDFSDVPSPAVRDGQAYICSDRGIIYRINIATGKKIWEQSLPESQKRFSASPVLAGSTLYVTREDGATYVLLLRDDGFSEQAMNEIGEAMYASPVLCREALLLRTVKALYCIGRAGR